VKEIISNICFTFLFYDSILFIPAYNAFVGINNIEMISVKVFAVIDVLHCLSLNVKVLSDVSFIFISY
jgi:hypothetical protein